jgi:hypothetical protein
MAVYLRAMAQEPGKVFLKGSKVKIAEVVEGLAKVR